jgi:hypothetical protein
MHRTKFLIASAAILSCSSVESFSPSFGMRPLQQQAFVFPTTTTELYGKKKKNKFNKKNAGGKGRGGAAAVAVLEKPTEASVEVVEEQPVAVPVAPAVEAPQAEGEFEDPAVKMIANELFQRKLLAQKLEYDAKGDESEPEETVASIEESPAVVVVVDYEKEEIEKNAKKPETVNRRSGPLDADEEAKLAAKYAAIDDVGERAFEILLDLGFFDREE